MNKVFKALLCTGVCGTLLFSIGCKKPAQTEKTWDTETRTLALSTGAVDGNFNPFFYTAQNDGNMVSLTQIAMLINDETGELVCGQNQPTAVLDYKSTMYNTKTVGTGSVTAAGSANGRTEYEFVIKNGIKFSDGKELTIHDVLFNLYVYLDPSYTGSSTIYSTDIQGLKAYRAQDSSLTDDSTADYEAGFVSDARSRIYQLIAWSNYDKGSLTTEEEADLEMVKETLEKELETDWTGTESSWTEQYKDTHRFTETWQAYLYEHGLVSEQMIQNTNTTLSKYKDEDGRVYTTLDPWQPNAYQGGREGEIENQAYFDAISTKTSDEDIKDYCIGLVYQTLTDRSKIAEVLQFWSTGTTILETFTNEARADYFASKSEDEKVKSISGITYTTVSGADLSNFNGKMGESYVANENYSVLKIVINGVDPKAIYNFSFPVAPLHYYSGTYTDKNGTTTNYVEEAMNGNGFGVAVGDPKFIENVLQDSAKSGVPVGAGPYMAADMNGNPTDDRNKFKDGTIISFVRNDYFETLGSGISNAKIKKVQYKVLKDDEIMDALTTKSIDFGMPNATPTNRTAISNNSDFLDSTNYLTGGYGYIGINPKFIPEVYVRQAIMKAMDTTQTISFYGSEYASVIYRPMTQTSWAYPEGIGEYSKIAYATDPSEITTLVERAGYVKGSDGIYVKERNVAGIGNAPIGTKLKFPFTIAGDSTNHPAYQMFTNTRDKLNELGFDITVKTSSTALTDLATGNLEVWAAAWTSAIDPDPYQVYHKDSQATSVLNWNYKNILNAPQDWEYEYEIISGKDKLSDLIDEGRSKIEASDRIPIYHECLDLIMDLAVELPTYQRKDLCVYNKTVIDANSLVKNPSYYMGLFDKLWEIDYV